MLRTHRTPSVLCLFAFAVIGTLLALGQSSGAVTMSRV